MDFGIGPLAPKSAHPTLAQRFPPSGHAPRKPGLQWPILRSMLTLSAGQTSWKQAVSSANAMPSTATNVSINTFVQWIRRRCSGSIATVDRWRPNRSDARHSQARRAIEMPQTEVARACTIAHLGKALYTAKAQTTGVRGPAGRWLTRRLVDGDWDSQAGSQHTHCRVSLHCT